MPYVQMVNENQPRVIVIHIIKVCNFFPWGRFVILTCFIIYFLLSSRNYSLGMKMSSFQLLLLVKMLSYTIRLIFDNPISGNECCY